MSEFDKWYKKIYPGDDIEYLRETELDFYREIWNHRQKEIDKLKKELRNLKNIRRFELLFDNLQDIKDN